MAITRSDAIAFLLSQKRESERAAREARERGATDHVAEARAQQFGDIAEMLSNDEVSKAA